MKRDFQVVLFCVFVAECARGIVMPTLGLGILAQGGTLEHVAAAVSLFSVGRLFFTVPFGHLAARRSFLEVFVLANSVCIVGQALYAAFAGKTSSLQLVLFSRFLIGVGSSILGASRAYLVLSLIHI